MPSKQQDVAKSNISPVLFLTVDGEPMSFFLRPGPVKRTLQPLITAGGGLMCSVQQPGAILLIDPKERGSIPETTAHWYMSTQYIYDCIEKDEQLNLEDYRLNPEVVPKQSAGLNNTKESSPGLSGGRIAYTSDDDAAILRYVSKHKTETGGNRLWQEMEKQQVTSHSWQSMKYRYRVRLAKKQSEVVEVVKTEEDAEAAEGEIKVEGNQDAGVEKPSNLGDAAPPQTYSTESTLTQIDAQPIPAESTQPDSVEAQTSISSQGEEQHVNPQTDKQPAESTQPDSVEAQTSISFQGEEQHVNPQTDKQPAESTQPDSVEAQTSISFQGEEQHVNLQTDKQPAESSQEETVEAETCNSPQPEGACLDPQMAAESTEPAEPQTIVSPQEESVLEDSPQAQPKSLPDTSSQKKPKAKQKAAPKVEEPSRRLTRRQLQLEESLSPEPYGKKLRSSSTSVEQLSSSTPPSTKTKSAVKSALQKDTTIEQPPPKRARGKSAAVVAESQQEDSGQATVSETTQADTESNSTPHKGEKKKEKRKLGILELATREFEDESESGEDEAPVLQNPPETATIQPASTEPSLPTADTAADAAGTQSNPEHGPRLQENVPETPATGSNRLPETRRPEPAATEAHLFIFDSESQEEDTQSLVAPASPKPTVNKDAAFSLTQVQLEEDKKRITELMNQTNQDLVSVTKALLKTSGDFSAALDLLLNPFSTSGPFWDRCDDNLLLSADPVVRQQLQDKYSEEDVAKRIVFLEVEG